MAYSVIKKPSDYFNTKLWTGNSTDDTSITGVGFQPDFTWIKRRDSAGSNRIYDTTRGVLKRLITNSTSAESTEADTLQAFESDGFQIGADSILNASGGTYASWNLLANGTGVANTDGSISSTVSANTTSGFSIVSYTGNGTAGATIGHGLSQKPSIIITKRRDSTSNWLVYSSKLGATKYLELETTNAGQTATSRWNDTEPTSSVFSVGTSTSSNPSSGTMIAYCFAEKTGYSKFGSYTGNGNVDGTFVYTGFKPAFVISKASSTTSNWHMWDNKRDIDNVIEHILWSNLANAEITSGYTPIDFLSNGFKMRDNNGAWNGSGTTYIYMAFAEEPLVGDNPATAR